MMEQVTNYATAVVAGGGGLVALGLYLRKIFKNMGLDDNRRQAEVEIINNLRGEVSRLSTVNTDMGNAVANLQTEVIKLRNENIALMGEIAAMKVENANLTAEILKLNEQLKRFSNVCDDCEFKKAFRG